MAEKKQETVAFTRPIKHLNAHQYKSLRRKARAAAELTRLGVSCARAEHKRTGKYALMPAYDKNLKKLDIARELGTDIRQYTERVNCDAPIKAHIAKVAKARKNGQPVNSKPPRAAYYPARGYKSFGFTIRNSSVHDERHIVMPLSQEEKYQIRENGKRKYRQACTIARIKKKKYVDWYVSEYKRTHRNATDNDIKRIIAEAVAKHDDATAIVAKKMSVYVNEYLQQRQVVLTVPREIKASDVRSVQIIPDKHGRSFKAMYSVRDADLEKPDEIDALPPHLATRDIVRVSNAALRRYRVKHRRCWRVDVAIDLNVKNLLVVTLIAVYKDKQGNITGEPFYSIIMDGGWLLSILRLTGKNVGAIDTKISELRKMTFDEWREKCESEQLIGHPDDRRVSSRFRKQRHLDRLYDARRTYFTVGRRRSRTCIDIIVKNLIVVLGYANVSRVVVGHNIEQKQASKLRGHASEHYQKIEYSRIRDRLRRWCGILRWDYVETEESYTSKASAVDNDDVPVYEESKRGSYRFSGKRVRRGLYRAASGVLLNADVNGALNIWRKATPSRVTKSGEPVKRSHGAPVLMTGSAKWLAGVYHPNRVSAEPQAQHA